MTELHTHRGVVTCAITNVYASIEACVLYNLDLKLQKLIGYKVSIWPCDLMVPNGFMQYNSELKRSIFVSAHHQTISEEKNIIYMRVQQLNLVKTALRRFMCVCLVPEAGWF